MPAAASLAKDAPLEVIEHDFTAAHERAAKVERELFREVFRPRVRMTHREWAENRHYLSPEANALAAEAGGPVRYSLHLTPYHREVFDAISDPRTEIVVCKFPSQDGKTEIINAFIGRGIDVDPGPMLVLHPTQQMGEAWSKDRLAPMLRDSPTLGGKVRDARSRDAENTIMHKKFAGGHLTIVGSNSAAGLASRPIRDVLVDEVDRCAKSAGSEGDPIRLAFRRATTFRRGKKILISSPTLLDDSRIDSEYKLGTQEEFEIPCPHCGEFQTLVWGAKLTYGLKWDKDASGADDPKTAHYVCKHNGCVILEHEKAAMIDRYRYVARAPQNGPTRRSFTKNALGSKLVSWRKLVAEWLEIQGKILELQTFINTVLCELWDPLSGKTIKLDNLLDRRGFGYPPGSDRRETLVVPDAVAFLERSVDTQDDRLETAVWGFGQGEESWLIDWEILPGDPATKEPWDALADRLDREYVTESGAHLRPKNTFVDSGGHHSKEVYAFTRAKQFKGVFAIKGSSQEGAPLLGNPTRNNNARALLYPIGSFSGKETLTKRLARITEPGPGFVHLPDFLDVEQVTQLTRMRLVTPVNKGGRKWVQPKRAWEENGAVEMPHLYVYALAALQLVGPLTLRRLGDIAAEQAAEAKRAKEEAAKRPAATEPAPQSDEPPDDDPPPTDLDAFRSRWRRGSW